MDRHPRLVIAGRLRIGLKEFKVGNVNQQGDDIQKSQHDGSDTLFEGAV